MVGKLYIYIYLFIRENPIKMDDLGVPSILGNLQIWYDYDVYIMGFFL